MTTSVPTVLVVSGDRDIRSFQDLAARLKAAPDRHNYGSNGVGASSHIACKLLANRLGVPDLLHVPFKQGSQGVMSEVMAGRLTFAVDSWSVVGPLVRSGRLGALGARHGHYCIDLHQSHGRQAIGKTAGSGDIQAHEGAGVGLRSICRAENLHVAQSQHLDIGIAKSLGLKTCGSSGARVRRASGDTLAVQQITEPDWHFTSLSQLADAVDAEAQRSASTR